MRLHEVTQKIRSKLKRPLGLLLTAEQIKKSALRSLLTGASPLVAVGDATTDTLLSIGITPSIQVIDGREMRLPRPPPKRAHATEIHLSNPSGHLSDDSIRIFASIMKHPLPVRVIVRGEEDLLALVAAATIPEGGVILYGQPKKGIVVVKLTKRKKESARRTLQMIGLDTKK